LRRHSRVVASPQRAGISSAEDHITCGDDHGAYAVELARLRSELAEAEKKAMRLQEAQDLNLRRMEEEKDALVSELEASESKLQAEVTAARRLSIESASLRQELEKGGMSHRRVRANWSDHSRSCNLCVAVFVDRLSLRQLRQG
jgi:hypothetical protein